MNVEIVFEPEIVELNGVYRERFRFYFQKHFPHVDLKIKNTIIETITARTVHVHGYVGLLLLFFFSCVYQ